MPGKVCASDQMIDYTNLHPYMYIHVKDAPPTKYMYIHDVRKCK